MKITELKRKLRAAGCYYESDGKNHEWWWSPITGQRFQVPRHMTADVGKELLRYLKDQSGVKFR